MPKGSVSLTFDSIPFKCSLNSETGVEPFPATFGSVHSNYFKIDSKLSPEQFETAYVRLLDESLSTIREVSKKYQSSLIAKRVPSGVNIISLLLET